MMGSLRFLIPFLLFFQVGDGYGVHTRSISSLQLHTRSIRKQLHVGDNITLPCIVIGPNFNPFNDQILWYKIVEGSNNVSMNTGGILKEPFMSSGRYTITPDMKQGDEPQVSMPIFIQGVTIADSGSYFCQLVSAHNRVTKVLGNITHSLIVIAPVDTLTFSSNETHTSVDEEDNEKTTFEFAEDMPSHVSCKAEGGNPEPTLKIFRGKKDITDEFTRDISNVTKSGPLGLQVLHHTVELYSTDFTAPISYRGEHMRCVAKIHKGKDLKRVKNANIDVKFAPRFDCEATVMAWPGDENVTLLCRVSGNPVVDVRSLTWSFAKYAGNNTLEEVVLSTKEATNAIYSLNTVLDDIGDVVTKLTIRNATEEAFQTYTIEATNDMGTKPYEIKLSITFTTQEPTTEKPTTEAKTPKPRDKIIHSNGEKPAAAVTGGTVGNIHATRYESVMICMTLMAALKHLL